MNYAVIGILCRVLLIAGQVQAQTDPLSSWNDGAAKQAIIQFVQTVTEKSNPNYVAPEDRIATFDQDGTLWVEHPLYTQAIFELDRVKTLAHRASGMEDHRALQVRARGRQGSYGQVR